MNPHQSILLPLVLAAVTLLCAGWLYRRQRRTASTGAPAEDDMTLITLSPSRAGTTASTTTDANACT